MNKRIVGSVLALGLCCSLAWFVQAGDKESLPPQKAWFDHLSIPEGASNVERVDAVYAALLQKESDGMDFDCPANGESFRKALADHHESRLASAIMLASRPDSSNDPTQPEPEPGERPEPLTYAQQRDMLRERADSEADPTRKQIFESMATEADALASGLDPAVVAAMSAETSRAKFLEETKVEREAKRARAAKEYAAKRKFKRLNPETGELEIATPGSPNK
jgi:hypothetical protein